MRSMLGLLRLMSVNLTNWISLNRSDNLCRDKLKWSSLLAAGQHLVTQLTPGTWQGPSPTQIFQTWNLSVLCLYILLLHVQCTIFVSPAAARSLTFLILTILPPFVTRKECFDYCAEKSNVENIFGKNMSDDC